MPWLANQKYLNISEGFIYIFTINMNVILEGKKGVIYSILSSLVAWFHSVSPWFNLAQLLINVVYHSTLMIFQWTKSFTSVRQLPLVCVSHYSIFHCFSNYVLCFGMIGITGGAILSQKIFYWFYFWWSSKWGEVGNHLTSLVTDSGAFCINSN